MNSSSVRTRASGRRSCCEGPSPASGSAAVLPCFVEESRQRIVLVESREVLLEQRQLERFLDRYESGEARPAPSPRAVSIAGSW